MLYNNNFLIYRCYMLRYFFMKVYCKKNILFNIYGCIKDKVICILFVFGYVN